MPDQVQLEQTCATCRFITYTRTAQNGPEGLFCENGELMQVPHDAPAKIGVYFRPPRLAFSCNRWAMRKADLGFPPAFVLDEKNPDT